MTISLRLNDQDAQLFKNYAAMNGMTLSDLIRETVLSRIEDEYDLKSYQKAIADYNQNPQTYTLDEVEKELGLL